MNMNINLSKEVEYILQMIEEKGYEAFIVGGCVRDNLLGRTPHDYDICTSATPDVISKIFEKYHVIETGLQHGTLTVMMNHIPFEITTFRIDGDYSDNRRPDTVIFTTNIKEDLSRRDLTVNSVCYSPKTGLVDPFSGYQDMQDKIIRCVGNANQRFREDALRILRAMRFSAELGFVIENETKIAMLQNKELLCNISAERIYAELSKMLLAKFPIQKIFMDFRDVIAEFIPEFIPCFDFNQNNPYHIYDVYNHIIHAVDSYKGDDLVVKLALLFHDIEKPACYFEDAKGGHFHGHAEVSYDTARKILRRLKVDNETQKAVSTLVLYHDSVIEPSHKAVRKWLNKIGEKQFRRLLEVRSADIAAQSQKGVEPRLEKQAKLLEILEDILSSK